MNDLCDDLAAEHDDLDRLVDELGPGGLVTPTPAPGWTVADQVGHLAWFDRAAVRAATDPERFTAELGEALAAGDIGRYLEATVAWGRGLGPDELLATWRAGRAELLAALRALDPATRVPWYGPAMSGASFTTARLMETWAHGQDVADAVGVERTPTGRLRHVAHIGVRALPHSFANRGLPVPEGPVRVELDEGRWTWGPEDAPDRVTGPALDFCLLVTQRRHRDDTSMAAEGPVADAWLAIAQAYAGPPGPGRPPRG